MYVEKSVLNGYVEISVAGSSCERFFNLCVNHNISFTRLLRTNAGYTAVMRASDFLKIKRMAKKCCTRVRIKQKHGFPFFLKQHRKRKIILLGWIWCCFFLYLLSLRIWKIEIKGNQEITHMQIMRYLSSNQISYGTLKKQIDCKQAAANLRNAFPNVTWVAVKKQGTMLEINLKENTDKSFSESEEKTILKDSGSSLVSRYDGKIIEIVTRQGVPLVKAGDTVKKGDILVSGIVTITNDENKVIKNQPVAADADIIVEFSDTYTDQFSRKISQSVADGKGEIYPYLKIFQKTFSLRKPGDLSDDKEVLSAEQQLTLFSDFYLPVIWGTVTVRPCKTKTLFLSETAAREQAQKRLDKFIMEKEEKGLQILKKDVRIDTSMTVCKCICTYQAYTSDMQRIPAMQMEESEKGTFS